ncbi:MAG TPA: response regulator [Acidobacteriaceae bacterium]|jgi:CheY-like chemotaxis protein
MLISPIQVLLVEDNPGDARLAREALRDCKLKLETIEVHDGEAAMNFLHQQSGVGGHLPDLMLLDLNLPKKDGREVLCEVKGDPQLSQIPIVILTSSKADEDILQTYQMHANCYICKPIDLEQMQKVVKQIGDFWFTIVKLPSSAER